MAPRIPIFNIFGPSPLGPLEKHINKAHDCAERLLPFFEAVLSQNWKEAETIYNQIAEIRKEADQIKTELRLRLHKDLFLPVPRNDLLTMLVLQDRIASKAKDIAGIVLGRKTQFPKELASDFMVFLKRSVDASAQARKAINELDELLETGFRGKEVQLVEGMLEELGKIERDTDAQEIKLRQILYSIEKAIPPVDVMFLYKIIEWTGELADRAETVGGQLQILLAR